MCLLLVPSALQAASNSPASNEVLQLRPPRGEIPLTFWEQHRLGFVTLAVIVLVLAAAAIWYVRRPRPAVVVTPEVFARRALEPLRQQSEDGALLSSVSQIVRRYVSDAFDLPRGEMTTTEFCRALDRLEKIGPEVAAEFGNFLRRCDERKFAPAGPGPAIAPGAVAKALELIERAEARLAALRNKSQESDTASAHTGAAKG